MRTYKAELLTNNNTPYSYTLKARFCWIAALMFRKQNKGGRVISVKKIDSKYDDLENKKNDNSLTIICCMAAITVIVITLIILFFLTT